MRLQRYTIARTSAHWEGGNLDLIPVKSRAINMIIDEKATWVEGRWMKSGGSSAPLGWTQASKEDVRLDTSAAEPGPNTRPLQRLVRSPATTHGLVNPSPSSGPHQSDFCREGLVLIHGPPDSSGPFTPPSTAKKNGIRADSCRGVPARARMSLVWLETLFFFLQTTRSWSERLGSAGC